jgi:hypothetical protein
LPLPLFHFIIAISFFDAFDIISPFRFSFHFFISAIGCLMISYDYAIVFITLSPLAFSRHFRHAFHAISSFFALFSDIGARDAFAFFDY